MSDAERTGERLEHEGEEVKGKAKEVFGKVTGNEEMEAEGKGDQLSANAKQAGDDLLDAAENLKDKLT